MEYFVQVMARLMDQTGASREDIQTLVQAEAATLQHPTARDAIMPACLELLNQSGL